MPHALNTLFFSLALFVAILLALECGRRIGGVLRARHPGVEAKGSGAAEGAVFSLLGLLIAFTFSGAAARFEERLHLVTEEANDIGTAYLRVDLLPADQQPALRALFRRYVELRIETFRHAQDPAEASAVLAEAVTLQKQIWSAAVAGSGLPGAAPDAAKLLLPALNEMIDMTTTRLMATRNHPPLAIFFMLAALGVMGGVLIGYELSEKRRREWLHMLAFALVMAATLYVILDLEFPRRGLIRIDEADQVLIDLMADME